MTSEELAAMMKNHYIQEGDVCCRECWQAYPCDAAKLIKELVMWVKE